MSGLSLAGQRMVVFAPDIPWPANRGGRADVWRRLVALSSQGASVFLVHLYEPADALAPSDAHWAHLRSHLEGHLAIPMRRGRWLTLRRLALAPVLPWHAATRVPTPAELAGLLSALDGFEPTAVWLEGPWFGELARDVADRYRLPLLYRSHNVEFRYLRGQARVAARARDRLAWRMACIGLERYEWGLLRRADAVFDISMDDLAYWRARGLRSGHWLPPLPEAAKPGVLTQPVAGDLLFAGNLRTPNNLQGLRWLLQHVMPLVLQADPMARLDVVGSAPDAALRAELAALPYVRAHFDVASVLPHLQGARVLLNPVFVGSGVQLKTLDMLSTDTPLVTRSQGLRGLPPEVANLLHVADTAEAFAAAALQARGQADLWLTARQEFRRRFSEEGVAATVAAVLATLDPKVSGMRSQP